MNSLFGYFFREFRGVISGVFDTIWWVPGDHFGGIGESCWKDDGKRLWRLEVAGGSLGIIYYVSSNRWVGRRGGRPDLGVPGRPFSLFFRFFFLLVFSSKFDGKRVAKRELFGVKICLKIDFLIF